MQPKCVKQDLVYNNMISYKGIQRAAANMILALKHAISVLLDQIEMDNMSIHVEYVTL